MTVNSGLDALQRVANASPDAVTEARRRRDLFKAALETADDVNKVIPSGSLARGTHKDPIHDVDLLCVFDAEAHPEWGEPGDSALAALEYTQSLVRDKLGNSGTESEEVRRCTLRNHSVKCFLDDPEATDAFTVDVTPALMHPSGGLLIPERHSNAWVRSDPEYLMSLVAARHKDWNQFAKLVRVLKMWNSDHGGLMKSLVVEMLALHHLPVAAERQIALASFFTAAAQAVWQPICDPAGLCGEIQPGLDQGAVSKLFSDAAEKAVAAVESEAADKGRTAMCLWRDVFGDAYPEPTGGCGGSGPAVVGVAAATAEAARPIVDAPQG